MTEEQYAQANAVILRLETLYPRTFFVYEKRRKPLKIGIHLDLIAAGIMEPDVSLALGAYTRNIGYLCNLRAGAERIDLSGNPVDVVNAKHAAGAVGWAQARMQRKLAVRKQKEAQKRYTEAWATVDKLATLYSSAFFIKGCKRRPLALDGTDIVGVTEDEAKNALRVYTQSYGYLHNVREGADRVNLAGEPVGSVTADEAAEAKACRARIERRQQERKAAALTTIVEAAPLQKVQPTTTEAAQPKRRLLGSLI
jgi:sRNA-binding protein